MTLVSTFNELINNLLNWQKKHVMHSNVQIVILPLCMDGLLSKTASRKRRRRAGAPSCWNQMSYFKMLLSSSFRYVSASAPNRLWFWDSDSTYLHICRKIIFKKITTDDNTLTNDARLNFWEPCACTSWTHWGFSRAQ